MADRFGWPLDILVARKIGAPGHAEFAIGAVTARGTRVLNESALRGVMLPPGFMEAASDDQTIKAKEREAMLREGKPAMPLRGRVVILVDDGVATGMTLRAAIADVRDRKPEAIFVAVPVAPLKVVKALHDEAERVIVFGATDDLDDVYEAYEHFPAVSDPDAAELLAEHIRCLRFPYA